MPKFLLGCLFLFLVVFSLFICPGETLQAFAQTPLPSDIPSLACKEGESAIDIRKYAGAEFKNPEEISSRDGTLRTVLDVEYGKHNIAGCDVKLRSYNGSLVGPTLRVKPGDSIQITLNNKLPKVSEDSAHLSSSDSETPTQLRSFYNTTNLHTHGLHVSPKGKGDNVLRQMPPGGKYDILVQLPKQHPGGTNWYHPHLHHSTSIQVSSGMAGALIVEGNLDQLPEIAPAEEKIFVFQQISYGEDGKIRNYDGFGPGKWQESGRQITVNGQLAPKITMRPGEVQHWRFIHAGIRETISTQLQKGKGVLERNEAIQPANQERVIKLHEVAVDGIPLGHIDSWNAIELQPGYRSDVLVKIDQPGDYQLVDLPSDGLTGPETIGQLLATVEVMGEPMDMSLPSDVELAAVKVAEVPPDITDQEISGTQNVVFNLFCKPESDMGQVCEPKCEDGSIVPTDQTCPNKGELRKIEEVVFNVNDTPFDAPKEQARLLELGKTEEWILSVGKTPPSVLGHPFHIHVNPFQHTRLDPNGREETIWRDTLLVVQGKLEKVRTRYTDFNGQFVLHCHILDHEDGGMMQLVKVVKPKQFATSPLILHSKYMAR